MEKLRNTYATNIIWAKPRFITDNSLINRKCLNIDNALKTITVSFGHV